MTDKSGRKLSVKLSNSTSMELKKNWVRYDYEILFFLSCLWDEHYYLCCISSFRSLHVAGSSWFLESKREPDDVIQTTVSSSHLFLSLQVLKWIKEICGVITNIVFGILINLIRMKVASYRNRYYHFPWGSHVSLVNHRKFLSFSFFLCFRFHFEISWVNLVLV